MTRRALPVLACLVLVLAASMTHVAAGFGSLEAGTARGSTVGWLAAAGIDAGIAVLMWRLMEGHAAGRRWAVAGIALMSAVSAYANLDHALGVAAAEDLASTALTTWHGAAGWQVARVLVLSVTLPALTVVLAAVAHSDAAPARPTPTSTPAVDPVEVALLRMERRAQRATGREQAVSATVTPTAPDASTDGRRAVVAAYLGAHPSATDIDVERETGVPRSTVGRWRRAASATPSTTAPALPAVAGVSANGYAGGEVGG